MTGQYPGGMFVRSFLLAFVIVLSACAGSAAQPANLSASSTTPSAITFQNMYWGNETSRWTVSREGDGQYADPQRSVTFRVSAETFDRVRDILRSYEDRDFQCRRTVTDGPYGYVTWSWGEGKEDRRTLWDAGCMTGDADDLFRRLDAVMEILVPLRDAGAPAQ